MRLLHYSAELFEYEPNRAYEGSCGAYKPAGLWVSVEGEDDWKRWCEGEGFGISRLALATEIVLKPDANVLLLETELALLEFNQRFSFGDGHYVRYISWEKVKEAYQGVIIAPYQWTQRCELSWYYSWDCASGVIWDLAAVAEVRQLVAA